MRLPALLSVYELSYQDGEHHGLRVVRVSCCRNIAERRLEPAVCGKRSLQSARGSRNKPIAERERPLGAFQIVQFIRRNSCLQDLLLLAVRCN
jgi:hypothetical protein